jgi:hypothetical protein
MDFDIPMTEAPKNSKALVSDDDAAASPADRKARRDREILRLWDEKWMARRIADHLGVKIYTVNNVIYKNGRARKPQGPRKIIVSAQDAPAEAWRQAMLPQYVKAADDFGMKTEAWRRAFILACLLLAKDHDGATSFIAWACEVTGYERDDVATFVDRGERGDLIVSGRPNEDAFRRIMNAEESGDFALVLMVGVFKGTFERTADDRYWLGGMPLPEDVARWEDDGGCVRAAA